ncbi:MAG: hypothetical protein GX638_14940 [Crenarchaeota archaeon]|nr:hypothetical protein [Thermoproteota archaeon]
MENFIDKNIKKWIKIVNAEYGLSNCNQFSINYFNQIKHICRFIFKENWYLIYAVFPDMWGNLELNIISYYIVPQKRTFKRFMKLQSIIKIIAKRLKCRYIIQGSHLNDKLFKYLEKSGYKNSSMKLEVDYGN